MIDFPDHAREQMEERGVTEDEVWRLVEHGRPFGAREPRFGMELVFTDGYDWKGRHYAHKRERAALAREGDDIVVVTVFAYYGRWED